MLQLKITIDEQDESQVLLRGTEKGKPYLWATIHRDMFWNCRHIEKALQADGEAIIEISLQGE